MFHPLRGRTIVFNRRALSALILITCFSAGTSPVLAGSIGMLADNGGDRVSIFDGDSDSVSFDFAAKPGNATGDCAVSSDEALGVTTNSSSTISFVSLGGSAGSQASGLDKSDLTISNLGVDMALSPDDTFLVSAGGGALAQPLSVIDMESRTEVSAETLFYDHSSVDFCDDGTLLVTTSHGKHYGRKDNALYTADVSGRGDISLRGSRISSGSQPNNSACAPGSAAGVMLDRNGTLTSFTLPGLKPADVELTNGEVGISASFSRDGRRLFVRTRVSVEAYDFNPKTGAMQHDWSLPLASSSTFYGMDQIAVHPDGEKLYVDGGNELLILDASNGHRFGAIAALDATGVCFANAPMEAKPEIISAASVALATAP